MKSIRLALMFYFLGLLAVALLTASLLVDRTAEQTLQARKRAIEKLIEAQYRERCQDENEQLDSLLREQAQSLARLVQLQFDGSRAEKVQALFLLGMLTAQHGEYVPAMMWMAESLRPPWLPPAPPSESTTAAARPVELRRPNPPNPLFREVQRRLWRTGVLTDVTLKEEVLLPGDGAVCDYFQVDYPPGKSYLSQSMGGRSFPLDPSAFPPDQLIYAVYDDRIRDNKNHVRRVVLKASNVEMRIWPGFRNGPSRRRGEATRLPESRPGPTVYVHCAVKTDKRDAALAGLRDRRDEELTSLQERTHESLRDLRLRLLAISLAVFAATGVGGFWLVRRGLSPLQRVSDAVSRVSPKDFRLPLDGLSLPRELRPIVEHLRGTLDLLKRTFAREKQAAADISHELRTPLAALMTTTEFALRKPRSAEQYRELLHDVHASAQQMHLIIDRLLTLARLDAGVDSLRVQTVDVAALAQQCAGVIRPLAEARGLTLTVKTSRGDDGAPLASTSAERGCVSAPSACSMQTDPDKLREIITNLLHNAIQYNRSDGSIDLRVSRENGTLEVAVEDTGVGIAPETRERIFERFYRADPSRGGDDLHCGLGLAIVKEYINLMGGAINVESTEGQGSTFRVLLPAR